jgi:hypothetical protein
MDLLAVLGNLLKLVNEYGLALVALGVLSMIMHRVASYSFNVVQRVVDRSIYSAPVDEARLMADIVRIDRQISQLLADITQHTSTDVALILQFHNGTFYLSGAPSIKLSLTHSSRALRPEITNSLTSMPMALFNETINYLVNNSHLKIQLADERPYDFILRGMMKELEISGIMIIPIRNSEMNLVGLLVVACKACGLDQPVSIFLNFLPALGNALAEYGKLARKG